MSRRNEEEKGWLLRDKGRRRGMNTERKGKDT